jgi:hypothetical protein
MRERDAKQQPQKKGKNMWIYQNKSFLSIVQNKTDKDLLVVRGRRDGDIEAVFPNAEPIHTPHRDYLYRANLPHEEVARAMYEKTLSIDYTNFKDSVDDMDRHDEYLDVWMVMRQGQLNRTGVEEL